MSKLYNIKEHPKAQLKRDKAESWRRRSKSRRRFISSKEMAIIKHDLAVDNSKNKRGEIDLKPNEYLSQCGCGAIGCFVHGSFETVKEQFYR